MWKNKTESDEPLFGPVKAKRTFEEICNEIKKQIFKGILKPGDRLPSEIALAGQFNVSRQTIREALRLLEISGFISMQKRGPGGPLIVDTILSTITNSFLDAFQMKKVSIKELTMARLEIEKLVLSHVLSTSTKADIRSLEENVAQARKVLAMEKDAFRENIQFHKLLAKASGNHVFVIVMDSLLAVVSDIRSRLRFEMEVSASAARDHMEIVNAIKHRDNHGATAILEKHLQENGKLLGTLLLRYEGTGNTLLMGFQD